MRLRRLMLPTTLRRSVSRRRGRPGSACSFSPCSPAAFIALGAWASRRVSSARLVGNWTIVWIGNFVGALGTAILVYFSEQYTFGDRLDGSTTLMA